MSQTGKLMPNLDQQSTKMLNLTVLQRIDPFIEEILITAAHVTFYEFNIESNQWSRKDVEGSLFVVKRNTQPRFQFIVMNRRNTGYLMHTQRFLQSQSEFEELEAVPSMSVIEGPLEPSSTVSAPTDGPEDSSFDNFFSAAMNIGSGAPNLANSRQPYHSAVTVSTPSHTPNIVSPPSQTPQLPSLPLSSLPTSVAIRDTPDPISSSNRVTNLVKPSSFFTPPSSSTLMAPPISSPLPTAPALHPPLNLQRPYGTPMLQPFPPPTPPPSLTPSSSTTPVINRDKVRDALLTLVQDDQFIDMFYQALLKVHHS
uniref:mRNA-decapping enzyme C-terminal domain-containing protein n=1 Tax=Manihot esculenta TaxID=3983 RepID=A0A2C9V7Z4_MANES